MADFRICFSYFRKLREIRVDIFLVFGDHEVLAIDFLIFVNYDLLFFEKATSQGTGLLLFHVALFVKL